jgi:hypothetical protein
MASRARDAIARAWRARHRSGSSGRSTLWRSARPTTCSRSAAATASRSPWSARADDGNDHRDRVPSATEPFTGRGLGRLQGRLLSTWPGAVRQAGDLLRGTILDKANSAEHRTKHRNAIHEDVDEDDSVEVAIMSWRHCCGMRRDRQGRAVPVEFMGQSLCPAHSRS